MIEGQYSVNIYFIVVAFDINLGVTSCSLLAGGVFRCPSCFLVHINVRSLLPKLDQLREMLSCRSVNILDSSVSNPEVKIDGYTIYRNDRGSKHGGGVAVYVKKNLPHEECLLSNNEMEVLWIKVTPKHSTPFLVCSTYYRPPNANQVYLDIVCNIEAACDCSEILSFWVT